MSLRIRNVLTRERKINMAITKCHECAHQVSSTASSCPNCGAKPKRTKWWLWLPLGALGALLVVGATVGSTPEAKARMQDQLAIDLCWDEQKRPSNEPSEARFIAGTCEKMEADFKSKWGYSP
jgi:hypothetical protein